MGSHEEMSNGLLANTLFACQPHAEWGAGLWPDALLLQHHPVMHPIQGHFESRQHPGP